MDVCSFNDSGQAKNNIMGIVLQNFFSEAEGIVKGWILNS